MRAASSERKSPLIHQEGTFANAGVSLAGISPNNLIDPVSLGVTLGLLLGKQIGVFGLAALAIRTGLAKLPEQCDWFSCTV